VGGLLHLLSLPAAGDSVWAASTAVILVPLTWSVARTLARRDVGVDAIALVAVGFAASGLIVPVFGALLQEAIDG
jgi:hypothetical protein